MLTIAGGVFYVIGGGVVALLVGSLSSLSGDLGGLGGFGGLLDPCSDLGQMGSACASSSTSSSSTTLLSGSGLDSLGYVVAGFGVFAGIMIIIGGILFRSPLPDRRKIGGILAAVMILLGGLATLGGLVIGFFLAAIGVYLGLTYKASGRGMTFGLGPVGSVTLGSNSPVASSGPLTTAPAGPGPLNYCIKCGSQLRPGSVFCGACGARVVD